MGSRYVTPDTITLKISNNDTLTVKQRLNTGEERMRRQMERTATLEDLAIVLAYLVDWSLTYPDGGRIEIKGLSSKDVVSKIDTIDPQSFDEIRDAIVAHEDAMKAEREQEKKLQSTGATVQPISRSLSGAAGVLTGFAS